jgi:transcriptional regulator with XRE-family HTH domain
MRQSQMNPAVDQPHLGPLLRGLRVQAGWSIQRLATEAGIDRAHVSRIEAGIRPASLTVLRALADALALDIVARNGLLIAGGYQASSWPRPALWAMAKLRGDAYADPL